jgi:hypothetical protein
MAPDLDSLDLTVAQRDAIDRLILEGHRVIALKVMMDASGCALKDAMAVLASRSAVLRETRPGDFAVDTTPPKRFSS